jgi:hypothetical protein
LSFVAIPGDIDTDRLLIASMSSEITLTRTALPGSVVIAAIPSSELVESSEWTEDKAGEPLLDIRWKNDGMALQELFEVYSGLISGWVDGEFGDFFCYTTVFVDGLLCCDAKERWLGEHSFELAGLLRRDAAYAQTKASVVDATLRIEYGNDELESRYFGLGNALVLDWAFGAEIEQSSPVSHFWTTHVIENVLLQYWQLRSLDRRLTKAPSNVSSVVSAQLEVISGLEEYRSSTLMSGDARDIERHIGASLELDRTYARILERLDIIQQLFESRRTQTTNTRNILIAAISVVAAALLGLPAIKETLSVVSTVDTSKFPGVLATPLMPFVKMGSDGTWALYVLMLTLFAGALGVATLVRSRSRSYKRSYSSFGIPWNSIHYSLYDHEYIGGRPKSQKAPRRKTSNS